MIKPSIKIETKQFINYKTRPKDTLHSICTKFHSTPYRIRQLNPTVNVDDLEDNQALLVEINTFGKTVSITNDDSPTKFKSNFDSRDMTYMIKPLFLQIRPVDYSFVETKVQDDTDEFGKIMVIQNLFDFKKAQTSRLFRLFYIFVTGLRNNQWQYNWAVVGDGHLDNTIRKERDITSEVIERYNFKICMEDVYLVRMDTAGPLPILQIYLFGVLGVDPPLKDGLDNYGVVKVQLIQNSKVSKAAHDNIAKQLLKTQTPYQANENPMQLLIKLIGEILCTDLYQDNAKLYQTVLKKTIMNDKLRAIDSNNQALLIPTTKMHCVSEISFYDIISVKQMEPFMIHDKRVLANAYKKKSLPVLKSNTEILDIIQFETLIKKLPEYLQQNDWFLMYSPTKHGTSFEEMFRRCNKIGSHVLLIRDNFDVVFGAFLSHSWTKQGYKYFGSGESFVFTFKDKNLKVYPWTNKNDAFQMANDEGLHIGADERPAISIDQEMLRGSSFPCETFQNYVLAGEYNFKIIEMEIWGLQDECEMILRALRQKISYFTNNS